MLSIGADLQVYLYFGFLVIFLGAERLLPKRRPAESQTTRWRTNAGLTALVIALLPVLPVSLISAGQWAQGQGFGVLNLVAGNWPELVLVVVTLLLRGFISFATHFLNHKIPWLWRIHRVHHLDTELDVSSTVRFHPLEMPISMVIGLPMVAVLGLSPWVLIFYELFDVTVTLFSHSNLRVAPWLNRYLRYIIVTPDLHGVHHSTYRPETDSNYSAVFPIWDVLFGTFRTTTREPLATMPLGLDEVRDPQANRFWWLLRSPFVLPGRTRSKPLVELPS
jgi:sterol desaturase/sphingolipid hydroxylase (fatty acid hydroxylase superfamily)